MPGSAEKLLAGIFTEEEHLLKAAREAREKGFTLGEAYTPYAVHGLDEAMGRRRTRLGVVCFLLGMAGFGCATLMQLWTSAIDWPMNVGGKSHTAIPALVPVMFEMMVLFAAVGTVLAFFFRARLFPGKAASLVASGITDDRFVLTVQPAMAEAPVRKLLEESGAVEVVEVEA